MVKKNEPIRSLNANTMDIVLLIKKEISQLASSFTIPHLLANIPSENIYVITNKANFNSFEKFSQNSRLRFWDEDEIVDGLKLTDIQQYLTKRLGTGQRAGWYFQQFLKLGIALRPELSSDYLVWDADCVLLRPLQFVSPSGKVIITKSNEFHKPYFETLSKLLQIEREVDFSFISEHLVFNKELVLKMLSQIENKPGQPWWLTILDLIQDNNLAESGFSEYETYGNFVFAINPEAFEFREIDVCREGTELFGPTPTPLDLKMATLIYHYISFELWLEQRDNRFLNYLRILKRFLKKHAAINSN